MKLVITGDLRDVIDSYNREEISYSKMAEILNNKANERLKAINYTPCFKSDINQIKVTLNGLPVDFELLNGNQIKINRNESEQLIWKLAKAA